MFVTGMDDEKNHQTEDPFTSHASFTVSLSVDLLQSENGASAGCAKADAGNPALNLHQVGRIHLLREVSVFD